MIVAVIDPANTPHGYNWTFAFPMLLFIVIAVILYGLFSRPHRRVPARRISAAVTAGAPSGGTGLAASVAQATASTTAAGPADENADGPAQPAADPDEGSEASE